MTGGEEHITTAIQQVGWGAVIAGGGRQGLLEDGLERPRLLLLTGAHNTCHTQR